MAKDSGFVKRKSVINASRFLNLLMFNGQRKQPSSLAEMATHLELEYGIIVTRQGIDERFNDQSVAFLKQVFSKVMSVRFKELSMLEDCPFSHVLIRDSTKFRLPDNYAWKYQGYGGERHAKSMMSIQHEFDILTGNCMDIKLSSGRRNDQHDTKESSKNIPANSLLIRDLGYVTSSYLKAVSDQKSYFLNRLPPLMKVYQSHTEGICFDFHKAYKKMKKYSIPYMEIDTIVGQGAQVPCRLIMVLNTDKKARYELNKTTTMNRKHGHKTSKERTIRTKFNLLITNVEKHVLTTCQVSEIYGLRWQIELVFKSWKSLGKIDQVARMKIQRFECMLLARLIWLVSQWHIFQFLTRFQLMDNKQITISIWKFHTQAILRNNQFCQVINGKASIIGYLSKLIQITPKSLSRETKVDNSLTYMYFNPYSLNLTAMTSW